MTTFDTSLLLYVDCLRCTNFKIDVPFVFIAKLDNYEFGLYLITTFVAALIRVSFVKFYYIPIYLVFFKYSTPNILLATGIDHFDSSLIFKI